MTSSPGSMQASSVNRRTFFEPGTRTTSSGSTSAFSVRDTNSATACRVSMIPLAGV